uniref:Putative lectin/glucanase superfamily protein n=1 Tax=viral metagenome TaxID=1070528 RepID=A0A6M3IEL8_9ZZZZ
MASGSKPYIDVDYDTTGAFSSATALENSILTLNMDLRELKEGLSSFELTLENKGSYFIDDFPSIPTEVGLWDFIRVGINGKTLAMFRIEEIAPSATDTGDSMTLRGKCIGQVLQNRKGVAKTFRWHTAEYIIETALTDANTESPLADVNTSITVFDDSPLIVGYQIPTKGRKSLQEIILEVAAEAGCDVYIDSSSYPATIILIRIGHASVQLNTHLYFDAENDSNNVHAAEEPRDVDDVYNYITLENGRMFNSWIPNDGVSWTNFLSDDIYGTWWAAATGQVTLIDNTYYTNSTASIFMEDSTSLFDVSLTLATTEYAANLDLVHLEQNWLQFAYILTVGTVNLTLWDSEGHGVFITLPTELTWSVYGIAVAGDWTGWIETNVGDKAAFTDVVASIQFEHAGTFGSMQLNGLKFLDSTAYAIEQDYLQDTTSSSAYGRREIELTPPYDWNWRRMDWWGIRRLAAMAYPARVIKIQADCKENGLDPNTVLEDDASTAAKLLPGYSIQFEADRWSIPAAGETNGTYWRMVHITYVFGDGLSIAMTIVPAGQEGTSTMNYSAINDDRLLSMEDPLLGILASLAKKVKATEMTTQDAFTTITKTLLVPHHHTLADGSGQINTDQDILLAGNLIQSDTLYGTAAANNASFTITDILSHSSGYARGLYVNYTHQTNAITGSGQINALAVDINATADVPYVMAESIYTGAMGSSTIDQLYGWYLYMDNTPSATVNIKAGLDIEIDNTVATAQCDFLRVYSHGGAVNSLVWFAGRAADNAIEFLFDFQSAHEPWVASTKSLKIEVAGTTYWIPTFDGTSITLTGNLIPSADDTYDIGATGAEWRDMYLDGMLYGDRAIFSDATYPVLEVERTSTGTNNPLTPFRLIHTTTADMVDGFGTTMLFAIKDSSGTANTIGTITARRTGGADNEGYFAITPYFGGSSAAVLNIYSTDIRPGTDDSYDIGTSSAEWKDLFIDGLAYIDGFGEGYTLASTITGATALSASAWTITDTQSHNSGYARGLYINYTHETNAITGSGEINPLAVDMNATSDVVNAFAVSLYTGTFAGATVNSLAGLYIYMDDSPATIANKHALMLQMDCTTGSGTDSFFRLDKMGGTIDSVFWLTQAAGAATYMFDFEHSSTIPWSPTDETIAFRAGDTAYYLLSKRAEGIEPLNFYRGYDTDYGCVLYLPFEEGAGTTVYDQSQMGNDGVFGASTAAPTWTSGKYGKAILFDGANDLITVTDDTSLDLTSELTVSAWVNTNVRNEGGATYYGIVVKKATSLWGGGGYLLLLTPDGNWRFNIGDGASYQNATVVAETDVWTHVVGVLTSTHLHIYKNGVLGESTVRTKTPGVSGTNLIIGKWAGYASFNGEIDDVRIYNRALSAEEIRNHFINMRGLHTRSVTVSDNFRILNTSLTKLIDVDSTGHLSPGTDDTQDLGEDTTPKEWRNLYVDGLAYIDALGEDLSLNSNYINGWVTAATCTEANAGYVKIKVGGIVKRVKYFDDA